MSDPIALIDAYLDGVIDDAGMAELESLVTSDTAVADAFVVRSAMHRRMIENVQVTTHAAAAPIGRLRRSAPLAVAAAVVLAGVAVTAYLASVSPTTPDGSASSLPIVVVTDVSDGGTLSVDDQLARAGVDYRGTTVTLDSGEAEFMLANQVSVRLRGRSELAIHDRLSATLARGAATFDCPHDAKGYTVHLRSGARVVDLGTVFEVAARDDGRSVVRVVEGLVECIDTAGATTPLDERSFVICDAAGRVVRELAIPDGQDVAADIVLDAGSTSPIGIGPELEPVDGGGFATAEPAIDQVDDWIIEAIVAPETDQGIGVVAYNGHTSLGGFGIVQQGGRWVVLYGGVRLIDTGVGVEPGRRVALAAVRSAGTLRFYIDGRPAGPTFAGAPALRGGAFLVGGNPGYADQAFRGSIQRARIARLDADFDPANLTADPDDRPNDSNPTPHSIAPDQGATE